MTYSGGITGRMRQALAGRGGFTLIELILIIVVIAILLPMVLMPFTTSTRSIKQGPSISRLVYVARGNLAEEMDTLDTTWPTPAQVDGNGQYTRTTITETVDGVTYTTTISGQMGVVDMTNTFQSTTGTGGQDSFAWVTVTTTDADGQNITLNALKSRDYQ